MRVLIVGGGIGGLALAYWLRQFGHEPRVVESAPEITRAGYPITVAGDGLGVLRMMGLEDELEAHRIPVEVTSILKPNGKRVRKDDISALNGRGRLGIFIHRAELHRALYARVRHDVPVCFGTRVCALDDEHGGVAVGFSDGSSDRVDMVVGADGLHSWVRRSVFGAGAELRLGVAYAAAALPNRHELPVEAFQIPAVGCSVGLTGLSPERINALFWFRAPPGEEVPPEQRPARLATVFRDVGWIVPEVIHDLSQAETVFWEHLTQVRLPRWSKGRIALMGDAAHCLSPIAAHGAGTAVVGAWVLASALRDHLSIEDALSAYEARTRPGIERLQNTARQTAEMMLAHSRTGLRVQTFFMRHLPAGVMQRMMVKQFEGRVLQVQ